MKKNKLVIFGIGKISDVVYSNLKTRSDYEIQAFVCDPQYLPADKKNHGLPVVSTEEASKLYPPKEYAAFVAVGYQGLNSLRTEKFHQLKKMGYTLPSFIDPEYTYSQISKMGENCFVMGGSVLQYGLSMGDNNFIWGGSILGHHSTIGHHNWITSACNISGCVSIGDSNFFAINSTISDNVKIGSGNFFGANSLITKTVENDQVYIVKSTEIMKMSAQKFCKVMNY